QQLEPFRLELAHALGGQPELAPRLAKRLGLRGAVDPVAKLDDAALGLGQILHGTPQGLLAEAHLDLLLGQALVALEQVAERRLALLADRAVEARDRPGGGTDLLDLGERQVRRPGDLVVARVPAELRAQPTLGPDDLPLSLADVNRDA